MHQYSAWHSAQGIATLISAIRRAPVEPGMSIPEILAVAPPSIQTAKGAIAGKFIGAEHKAIGLAAAIEQVTIDNNCHYFNAGSVTDSSTVDGVHLDVNQHLVLGKALASVVKPLLSETHFS